MTAQECIQLLRLEPHPEGGYYREVYRSMESIPDSALPPRFDSERRFATSIYYLLQAGDYSTFHRIKSDETWYYHAGGTLLIHVIARGGLYQCIQLGPNLNTNQQFQFTVPAESWFAAEPASEAEFVLVGCAVAPGFEFEDFELGLRSKLLSKYQQHEAIIQRLTRASV